MRDRLQRFTAIERPRVVGPVTVGHGVNEFFAIVIPPVIPLLVADLGITYGQAGFLLTVFFVMYLLFQLPAGIIADRVGKRVLMVSGLVGMSVGVLIAGMAPSYEVLVVGQAIAGISGSTFHPAGMSVISDVETTDTEGKAMGVFGFGGVLGTMAAPIVVGGVAALAGWRSAVVVAALLGGTMTVVTAYVFLRFAPATGSSTRSDGGFRSNPHWQSVRETAGELATPANVTLFFVTMGLSMQFRAVQTFTTSYVSARTGATVAVSNVAFFGLLMGGSVASLWGGEFADRVNRYHLGISTAVGTALLIGTVLFVSRLIEPLPEPVLVGVLAVWFVLIGGVSYAMYPVKNALISERANEERSGSLFGVFQTSAAIGGASGPAIFGFLATEWGVVVAFPAIASVSVILAALFGILLMVE
ncbi:MAG: MFS transporter [Halanaeroarchaeum sp.]